MPRLTVTRPRLSSTSRTFLRSWPCACHEKGVRRYPSRAGRLTAPAAAPAASRYDSFRGSPGSSRGAHDRVARRIASNGQCWAETMWRAEDHIVYGAASIRPLLPPLANSLSANPRTLVPAAYRLYLEFARLVSPDRDTGEMVRLSEPKRYSPCGPSKDPTLTPPDRLSPGLRPRREEETDARSAASAQKGDG